MKILHISNDFSGSAVYKNLVKNLDSLSVEQIVYTPIYSENQINKNKIYFENINSKIIYRNILSNYTRLNFHHKRNKIYNDVVSTIDNIKQIDIVHAHTWFSDGAIAYKLYKEYQIPYIVAVRSTDITIFLKYMFHLRKYGLEILKNAKKIIFISEVYKNNFCNHIYLKRYLKSLEDKITVIPNGIDDFWINHINFKKSSVNTEIQLLYIGTFIRRKNLKKLIEAVNLLVNRGINLKLQIVGGSIGNSVIERNIEENYFIINHGRIQDKFELMNLIRKCDVFTMPSKSETFGLVYIEALSQGLPVVYTEGEGIDGFYDKNIGEAVDANNVRSIEMGILKIIDNYSNYNFNPKEIVNNHNWNKIAEKYINIYNKIK